MSNTLLTMESANLYCGIQNGVTNTANSLHLEITELKLPALNETYADHRAAGAGIAVEIDTVFNKLEATFQLLGWDSQVAELVASWFTNDNLFYAYGLIRDRSSGAAIQAAAQMKGRLGLADPQLFRKGDTMHWNYAIKGIIQYQLYLAGDAIYQWDYYNNVFLVGGVDRNADRTACLHLPAPTPSGLPSISLS